MRLVTAMSDSTSRQRQQEHKPEEKRSFREVLEKEAKRLEEGRGMEGKLIGYTRSGQAYMGQVRKRAYN